MAATNLRLLVLTMIMDHSDVCKHHSPYRLLHHILPLSHCPCMCPVRPSHTSVTHDFFILYQCSSLGPLSNTFSSSTTGTPCDRLYQHRNHCIYNALSWHEDILLLSDCHHCSQPSFSHSLTLWLMDAIPLSL